MNLKQLWSIFQGRRTNFSWMNVSWTYYPDGDPIGRKAPVKAHTWECAARVQGTAGGNDPADCDYPFCGCDPNQPDPTLPSTERGSS